MAFRVASFRRQIFSTNSEGLSEHEDIRRARLKFIFNLIKVGILLLIWLIFTIFIIIVAPREEREVIVSLMPSVEKVIVITDEPHGDFVLVEIMGKIDATKTAHPKLATENDTFVMVAIETYNKKDNRTVWKSKDWLVYNSDSDSDKVTSVKETFQLNYGLTKKSHKIISKALWGNPDVNLQATLLSIDPKSIPLSVKVNSNPMNLKVNIWIALLLLIFLYVLIAFELTDATFGAIVVASTAIGVLCIMDNRPSLAKVVSWIDMQTLMLLFGMMILLKIVSETGVFDYVSVWAFELAKGKVWRLLFYMYMATGALSAFLNNVTIVMLMVPVTIRICELLAINSSIVLVSVSIFSNIGGTMTTVGDPPNIIIASNEDVQNAGVNFGIFMIHMFPGVLLAMLLAFVMIYYMTRNQLQEEGGQLKRSIEALEIQAENNKGTVYAMNISKNLAALRSRLKRVESPTNSQADYEETLKDIKARHTIRDFPLLIKCSVAFVVSHLLFLVGSIPGVEGISLGLSAIMNVALLLILIDRSDVDNLLRYVEWSTLVFFIALFVLMEALVELGMIEFIGEMCTSMISRVDESNQLTLAIFLILWLSAFTSAFVDNIPIAVVLIKLIVKLTNDKSLNVSLQPLVWALSFGVCFGGNGTLLGASANMVTAGIARQHGYDIKFLFFLLIGFPIMLATIVVATIYLLIVHSLLEWH